MSHLDIINSTWKVEGCVCIPCKYHTFPYKILKYLHTFRTGRRGVSWNQAPTYIKGDGYGHQTWN